MLKDLRDFFAIAHDKGGNDGLGSNVQNAVSRKTLQMKVVVQDVVDFVEFLPESSFSLLLPFAQSMKLKPISSS